jgi:hypothetical protein
MKQFKLEVKVSGWITRVVDAESIEEAHDKATEIDWTMPLGNLQWKEAIVELSHDD